MVTTITSIHVDIQIGPIGEFDTMREIIVH